MATITEALAEIKTIGKRLEKKRASMYQYIARVEAFKDPLAGDGGSIEFIRRERQAVADLEQRVILLRTAIAKANATTSLAVNGTTRTIADWLTWRREIAPGQQQFLGKMRGFVEQARKEALSKGVGIVSAATAVASVGDVKPNDIIVNVSERELAEEIEQIETVLGELDGLLSLKNATTDLQV